jgi:hypothetical protein
MCKSRSESVAASPVATDPLSDTPAMPFRLSSTVRMRLAAQDRLASPALAVYWSWLESPSSSGVTRAPTSSRLPMHDQKMMLEVRVEVAEQWQLARAGTAVQQN